MIAITFENFAPHTAKYDGNSVTLYDASSNKIECCPVNTRKIGDLLVFKYEFSQIFVDSRTGECYISTDLIMSDRYFTEVLADLETFELTKEKIVFRLKNGEKVLLNCMGCRRM